MRKQSCLVGYIGCACLFARFFQSLVASWVFERKPETFSVSYCHVVTLDQDLTHAEVEGAVESYVLIKNELVNQIKGWVKSFVEKIRSRPPEDDFL